MYTLSFVVAFIRRSPQETVPTSCEAPDLQSPIIAPEHSAAIRQLLGVRRAPRQISRNSTSCRNALNNHWSGLSPANLCAAALGGNNRIEQAQEFVKRQESTLSGILRTCTYQPQQCLTLALSCGRKRRRTRKAPMTLILLHFPLIKTIPIH